MPLKGSTLPPFGCPDARLVLWPANGNWPYELRGGRADALAFLWMNAVLGRAVYAHVCGRQAA